MCLIVNNQRHKDNKREELHLINIALFRALVIICKIKSMYSL